MQFDYNGKTLTFPASLSEITLGQRVGFYTKYGKDLDEQAAKVHAMSPGLPKDLEADMLELDAAIKTFCYYTGVALEEARAQISLQDLMAIYGVCMDLLQEQERALELQPEYDWKGDKWVIAAPEVTPGSGFTLVEFITAKEVVRQLDAVGKGKWDALPYLCATYLRKVDEPFSEELIAAGSERLAMMGELPLDVALGVAFFLSSTLSIYMTTLASSGKEGVEELILQDTSTSGDGSAS